MGKTSRPEILAAQGEFLSREFTFIPFSALQLCQFFTAAKMVSCIQMYAPQFCAVAENVIVWSCIVRVPNLYFTIQLGNLTRAAPQAKLTPQAPKASLKVSVGDQKEETFGCQILELQRWAQAAMQFARFWCFF